MRLQIFTLEYHTASNYICWSVILIDNILKKDKNYYLQVFLIECKNIEKEKQVIRYTSDDSGFPSDFDESDHDGVFFKRR